MSKVYEEAPPAAYDLLRRALAHHPELVQHELAVKLVFVSKLDRDEELVRCLRCHGANADAIISLFRGKQRLYNPGLDAEITIDLAVWKDADERRQLALLDHEITHLELVRNKDMSVRLMDDGRPRYKLKPDDFTLTGFYATVRRYGEHATEQRAVTQVAAQVFEAMRAHIESAGATTGAVYGATQAPTTPTVLIEPGT